MVPMVTQTTTQSAARSADATAKPRLSRRLRIGRGYELACVGAVFVALVVFCAIFAPLISSADPVKPLIAERLRPPSLAHLFGTDEFGRDILTRVLYGARPMLLSGVLAVLVALLLGGAIGTLSGYFGGQTDNLLMRLMDIMLSFPAILLAILIVAGLGAGLTNMVVAIAFSMIPVFARLVRAVVLTLIHQDYILAARCLGYSNVQIIRRHILPNMLSPLLVQATVMLATAFSTAAALNFLGLGVVPPTPDWGLMVSEGQKLVFDAAWVPLFPGLAISLTVLSVNFIGDGLRDAFDPVLRRR